MTAIRLAFALAFYGVCAVIPVLIFTGTLGNMSYGITWLLGVAWIVSLVIGMCLSGESAPAGSSDRSESHDRPFCTCAY